MYIFKNSVGFPPAGAFSVFLCFMLFVLFVTQSFIEFYLSFILESYKFRVIKLDITSAISASESSFLPKSDSPCVSGSPQIGTDLVRTRLVSLIHNSQFRCTEWDRIAGKIPVQLAPLQV